MKICLISFDYWGFDRYIIEALQDRGIEATHIDLNRFRYSYPNTFKRVANGLSKFLFNKNIKKTKKQHFVLDQLEKMDHQDVILTIRPDLLDRKTHEIVKSKTNRYVAYLYDSTKRFPIDHLLNGIFDEIFSFDRDDCETYGFKKISNYIYLPKAELLPGKNYKHSVFIVISKDNRLKILNTLSQKLDELNVDYSFIVKSKKSLGRINPKIQRTTNDINPREVKLMIEDSKIMMDISRSTNTGLSFRVFESLAYQKKLITTNQEVKRYSFFDPNNILVIDPEKPEIPKSFFETPYKPLKDEVYNHYTVDNWIKIVFDLP